jgi:hypothetical protein
MGGVTFVAGAEVFGDVLGPHVRFGQEEAIGVLGIDHCPQPLEHGMRFGQVLVTGPFALDEIWDGVQPHAVDAGVEPEAHHVDDGFEDVRVVEVQIGLVAKEAVPIELFGHRIPCPVGSFRVNKDDARPGVFVGRVAPHVPVAVHRAARRAPRALEPRVLVAGVVDDQFGDDAQPQPVRAAHELSKVAHRPVTGIDALIVGDVVTVVAQRRGVERQQPDGRGS